MSSIDAKGRLFTFLLTDRFGMFSLSAFIDCMRSANRLSGKEFYSWKTVSASGGVIAASNNMRITADHSLADMPVADIFFVTCSFSTDVPDKPKILNALRQAGRQGGALGGLVMGSEMLAEAGLMDGYRCTIHWENRAAFRERFPDIECTGNIFEIDRKRYTCAGGTTAIDLMLEIIKGDFGPALAAEVANQFQHERIRPATDRQRIGRERDLNGKSEMMADHLEDPLTAVQLAASVKLSVRQVERLFIRHLGMTPGSYYMTLRLERARELLRQTNAPILDVALQTGFGSHSYFAQSYRTQFQRSPSEERRTAY
jgi:AraC family transcriptional regulator, glycine betaine-responsive activator